MDALFLEHPDEALRDAVALRLTHVGGCQVDAKPLDLGLDCLTLTASPSRSADRDTRRSPWRSRPSGPAPPGATAPAPASGRPSSQRPSRRWPRCGGRRPRRTSTSPPPSSRTATRPCHPEFVRPPGPDPAAVRPVPAGMAPPHRRQQPVLQHQLQHTVLADPDPSGRKPRLRLPVALARGTGSSSGTVRISSTSSSSLSAVLGPRFAASRRPDSGGSVSRARNAYMLERATHHVSHTIVRRVGPVRRRTHSSKRLKSFLNSSPSAPPATRPASSSPPASPESASVSLSAGSSSAPAGPLPRTLAATAPVPAAQPESPGSPRRYPPPAAAVKPPRPSAPVPPLSWTPDGLLNYRPKESGPQYG